MFAPALNNKVVDVAYYMAMGENAYAALAEAPGPQTKDKALAEIFSDLANGFASFVAVLSSVSPRAPKTDCDNLVSQFTLWQNNGDPAIAKELRQAGVFLELDSETAH